MKVRNKQTGIIGESVKFNVHGMSEILVGFDDDFDSDFIKNYDVFLKSKNIWKDMDQAFKDGNLLIDDYNTWFFEKG